MNTETPQQLLDRAAALQRRGRTADAVAAYQRLLALRPDYADGWYDLGFALRQLGRFDEALTAYDRALAYNVSAPEEVRLNRAVIYADHLRRDAAAQAELEAATALNPDYAPAWLNLGNLHEERGDRDAAAQCYERILPDSGAAYADFRLEALARLLRLRRPKSAAAALLGAAQKAADGARGADPVSLSNLFYSLGEAYDEIGDYTRAFSVFSRANDLVRKAGPAYSPYTVEAMVADAVKSFPAPFATGVPAPITGDAKAGPQPLFICGMFRSGSTLFEQVLSSHSKIVAGGELSLLSRLAARSGVRSQSDFAALSDSRARGLAAQYLDELQKLFPQAAASARYVCDKRPDNFMLIGLIKKLFPAAKIIHTVRQPLDNCLSVYFQHIDQRFAGYASDLADAAHYFGQYRQMMAHWKRVFGADIIDVDYDQFVAAPEPLVRDVLTAVGLEYESACMNFHQRRNTVKTASYWQVREPLYRKSSGRWRNYAGHLAPLIAGLKAAGVEDIQDTD
ncbi:MAG: sulfotransferase [Parvularculaceae bacterium]|nr:sulfotransferase [Parvularculaceae bacterium]